MRKIFFILLLLIAVFVSAFFAWLMRPFDWESEGNGKDLVLIAHAGGAIDGYTYTNSKEALMMAIGNGYQYVELDLYMTADSQLVCLHTLKDFDRMTGADYKKLDFKTFRKSQFFGKYSPMTLREAVDIWEKYPFIFVTDKISDPKLLNKYFTHNRQNVNVEVRRFWNYHDVEKEGYYAMLTTPSGLLGLIKYFCCYLYGGGKVNHIVIAKSTEDHYLRLYKRMGSKISVIIENDYKAIEGLSRRGIDMAYTDSLLPN